MPRPLDRSFFERDPVTCARELIGCTLEWEGCAGIIAETEAYAATGDEACHTWNRPSARRFVEEHPPGAAYVYFNYGMYWMLNALVKGGTEDGFVLFRALEPIRGIAEMRERRTKARRPNSAEMAVTALCSGPGKLAQALHVTGEDHGRDFCADAAIRIISPAQPVKVATCARIGISRAQDFPWRFLLAESRHVSVPARDRAGAAGTVKRSQRAARRR
jgi:DNA-3-methyladenine glycosylase